MMLSEWARPYTDRPMILAVPKKYDDEIIDHVLEDSEKYNSRDAVRRWYGNGMTLWGFPIIRVDTEKIYLFDARLLNDV